MPHGWVDTGDLGVLHEGSLYITGRAKEIIFINGMNYYPHDLENIATRAPGLDLNKVVAAGVAKPGVAGRGTGGVRTASRLHGGLPAHRRGRQPPHQRTHGTRGRAGHSREAHPQDHQRQSPAPPIGTGAHRRRIRCGLAELEALRQARGGAARVTGSDLESRLQSICETALPGKRIDVGDNLFEIGASSLKLIEIHETIDREFPGLIDLTELFDHPTIADLARHLQGKLTAA